MILSSLRKVSDGVGKVSNGVRKTPDGAVRRQMVTEYILKDSSRAQNIV